MRLEHDVGEGLARDTSHRFDELALDDLAGDSSTDAVVGLDAALRVTFWNRAAETMYRIAASDALGRPFTDLVSWHPHTGGLSQKPGRRLPETLLVNGPASHRVRPDRWIPVWVSVVGFRRGRRATGHVLVIRDDTEHLLLTANLRDRLDFEMLLSEMSARFSGLSEDDVDGEIHLWLCRLVQMLGVDRSSFAELQPGGGLVVTHTYAVPAVQAYPQGPVNNTLPWITSELAAGRNVVLSRLDDLPGHALEERRVMAESGLKASIAIPVSIAGSLVCVLTFGVFRQARTWSSDLISRLHLAGEVFANAVTRRQSKQKLVQKQNELAHVARVAAMGELASVIAHELDQPLTAVVSNAQAVRNLLQSSDPDLASADDALDDVIDSAMRVSEIVQRERRLLRKSRGVVEQGDLEQVDLNDALREVELFIRAEARQCGVRVALELVPGLPPVPGSRVQLQQVALNLARNGLQAMTGQPAGAKELTIRTESGTGEVVLSVPDSGPPIEDSLLERMFEPFYTTKPNGLGMGLSISKTIIADGHRGSIRTVRNVSGGLTMHVALPRK